MESQTRRHLFGKGGRACLLSAQTQPQNHIVRIGGSQDRPLKFNETLLRECWLGGSEAIRNDDDKFLAAGGILDRIVEIKTAELEKL